MQNRDLDEACEDYNGDVSSLGPRACYEPRVSLEEGLQRFFDWAIPEYRK